MVYNFTLTERVFGWIAFRVLLVDYLVAVETHYTGQVCFLSGFCYFLKEFLRPEDPESFAVGVGLKHCFLLDANGSEVDFDVDFV